MTRQDLTEIILLVDKSGSMHACKNDAEGGLNAFIADQRKDVAGEARLTLVEFADTAKIIHESMPLADVPDYKLKPGGNTALLDSLGDLINSTGKRFAATTEDNRPGLVCFVILTDGQENASKRFTAEQVRQMIETQTNVYKWQFTYLGANQDAFAAGGQIGVSTAAIADFDAECIRATYDAASSNVKRMRTASAGGQCVSNAYTDQEKLLMKSPKKKQS